MNDWLPIETAPKDAERIELWLPVRGDSPGRAVFGHWDRQQYNKRPQPYWTTDESMALGISWARQRQPSHWRPMSKGPGAPV